VEEYLNAEILLSEMVEASSGVSAASRVTAATSLMGVIRSPSPYRRMGRKKGSMFINNLG